MAPAQWVVVPPTALQSHVGRPEKSLATLFPEVAKEWHPTINGDLTPNDVLSKSHKKVWWQCPKDINHIYEARIAERTREDGKSVTCNCMKVYKRKFKPQFSLQKRFPDIAKEWHYEKNFPLTPLDISYGSKQKVWWQCT